MLIPKIFKIWGLILGGLTIWLMILRLQTPQKNTFLAFASNENENFDLYLLSWEDKEVHPIIHDPELDEKSPAWSPDGLQLVYAASRDIEPNDLYITHIITKETRRLVETPHDEIQPAWSPDGQNIIFASNQDRSYSLYQIELATGEITRLTNNEIIAIYPNWSQNGEEILFQGSINRDWDIYRLVLETGQLIQLPYPFADEMNPKWSPDGQNIIFASNRNQNQDIFRMTKQGSEVIRLTQDFTAESYPAWSDWGVVFNTRNLGNTDLVFLDGKIPRSITTNPATEYSPAWSPPFQPSWHWLINFILAGLLLLIGNLSKIIPKRAAK